MVLCILSLRRSWSVLSSLLWLDAVLETPFRLACLRAVAMGGGREDAAAACLPGWGRDAAAVAEL